MTLKVCLSSAFISQSPLPPPPRVWIQTIVCFGMYFEAWGMYVTDEQWDWMLCDRRTGSVLCNRQGGSCCATDRQRGSCCATDRQTGRQTERLSAVRQTDRQADRQRSSCCATDREAHVVWQTDRQTDTQTDRGSCCATDRQRGSCCATDRQTKGQTDREADRQRGSCATGRQRGRQTKKFMLWDKLTEAQCLATDREAQCHATDRQRGSILWDGLAEMLTVLLCDRQTDKLNVVQRTSRDAEHCTTKYPRVVWVLV